MDKIKLILFPFAGGNKYSYRKLINAMPPDVEVIPFEMPGRGDRMRESLLTDIQLIAEDAWTKLETGIRKEAYALYGHSMGSIVAYLFAQRAADLQYPAPLHLFVSGSAGPSVPLKNPGTHLLPRDRFIDKLRELGGSPDAVLNDRPLFDFFEPMIRADFQALETYRYKIAAPLQVPITVITGDKENITRAEALAWQQETTHQVEFFEFPGDHFFIYGREQDMLQIMMRKLRML